MLDYLPGTVGTHLVAPEFRGGQASIPPQAHPVWHKSGESLLARVCRADGEAFFCGTTRLLHWKLPILPLCTLVRMWRSTWPGQRGDHSACSAAGLCLSSCPTTAIPGEIWVFLVWRLLLCTFSPCGTSDSLILAAPVAF